MKILFVGNKSSLYAELYNQLSMHFPVKTAGFNQNDIYTKIKEFGVGIVIVSLKDASKEQLVFVDLLKLDPQWDYLKIIVIGFSFEVNSYQSVAKTKVNGILSFPISNEELIKKISEVGNIPNPIEYGGNIDEKMQKGKKHILVVDDDPRMLRAVKTWLEEFYKVSIVNSGKAAVNFLEKQKPDVMLIDYEMPDMNGPQTLEIIRKKEEFKDLAAFFLTGVSDSEKVKTAASLYPKGYILKGVSREELLMKINEFFYS